MSTGPAFFRLSQMMRAFIRERTGNVAVTFALTTIPIIAFVGAAVDYSQANATKAKIQAALNSTALMLSKEAATDTADQLQANAAKYFNAVLGSSDAKAVTISTSYSSSGGSALILNASAQVPTTFMQLLGDSSITVNALSTTRWGMSRLRVALVLDNTGSMADSGKMTALKTATKNLLSQLQTAAPTNGDVYVSIVPFVKDVNLDTSNYNNSWVLWDDGTDSSWDGANGSCSVSGYSPRSKCVAKSYCSISGYASQSSCTSAGACSISSYSTQSSCKSAGVCSKSSYTTQSKCTSKGYTWTSGVWTNGIWAAASWTPSSHSSWNGCVVDRGGASAPDPANYDTNVVAPTMAFRRRCSQPNNTPACPQAVMGLSYGWSVDEHARQQHEHPMVIPIKQSALPWVGCR